MQLDCVTSRWAEVGLDQSLSKTSLKGRVHDPWTKVLIRHIFNHLRLINFKSLIWEAILSGSLRQCGGVPDKNREICGGSGLCQNQSRYVSGGRGAHLRGRRPCARAAAGPGEQRGGNEGVRFDSWSGHYFGFMIPKGKSKYNARIYI